MVRAVSINGESQPVTSINVSPNRNPLAEEGLNAATPAKLFGGYYTVSGSIDCVYREWVSDIIYDLVTFINDPFTDALEDGIPDNLPTPVDIGIWDDSASLGIIESCVFNSVELPLQSKDFVRPKLSFIGKRMRKKLTSEEDAAKPDYTDVVGIFYSTIITETTVTGEIKTSTIETKSFTIKFDIGYDQDNFLLGSPYLHSYKLNALCEVSGTFTLTSKNDVDKLNELINDGNTVNLPGELDTDNQQLLGYNSKKIVITIGSSDGCGALGAQHLGKLEIPAGRLIFTDGTASMQGRQLAEKTINFRLVADPDPDNVAADHLKWTKAVSRTELEEEEE